MTNAVYKISRNPVQGQKAQGGLLGTAFFVDRRPAITADRGLNLVDIGMPNAGFQQCGYWLLGRNGSIIDCSCAKLVDCPEVVVQKQMLFAVAAKEITKML